MIRRLKEFITSVLFWKRELREREEQLRIEAIEREMRETTEYINRLVERTKEEREE